MKKTILILSIVAVLFITACTKVQIPEEINCGELSTQEERNACCAEQNVDTPHIMCVGEWQYTEQGCSWVCETPEQEPEESNFNVRYSEGRIYYNITVDKPTPCHSINVTESVMESYPVQVGIYMEMIESQGMCAQVITPELVHGSVETQSKPGSITFYLDGKVISSENIE